MKSSFACLASVLVASGLSAAAVTGGTTTTNTTTTAVNPGVVQNPNAVTCPKPVVAKLKEAVKATVVKVSEKCSEKEAPKPAPIKSAAPTRAKK